MESINQAEKGDTSNVYGAREVILCAHPHCKEVFEAKGNKKYHSSFCKDDAHSIARELGEKFMKRGKIRAALIENSPRLQRVAKFLSDGKPHSTWEIEMACKVCNVPANELRHPKNGFDIKCEREGEYWYYTMVGGQSQLLRII